MKNPLVILLTALGVLSFLTGDQRATVVIFVMVLLGVVLRFVQEMRADHAAEKLQAMVSNTATVVREGKESELSLKMLVPGDIVRLAAGDMVPADVRVLVRQRPVPQSGGPHRRSAARGEESRSGVRRRSESAGAARISASWAPTWRAAPRRPWSSSTGDETYFGSLAASIVGQRQLTSFDKGVNAVHLADDPFHRRDGAGGLPDQRAEQA